MAGWKKVIVSGSVAELHTLSISSASNAGLDTDKFLVVSSSGVVHFRTGAEVLSDIGAGAGSGDISSVVAGDGLTGGATTGDATLNVVGGTGITANANDIQITDGGVGTTQLADDAVTEDKLANTLLAEIDANTAKVTNVSTNLSKTTAAAQITINSSDGDNVIIGEATDTIAGLMSTTHHDKLDGIEASADVTDGTNVTAAGALMDSELATIALVKALTPTMISGSHTALSSSIASDVATNTAKATNVSTDLSVTTSTTTVRVDSSDGTNATIPVATTSIGGVMSKAIFDEHTANNAKNTNVSTNLSKTTAAAQITINSSDGDNVIIGEATDTIAGLMSTTHHDKLDAIEASADVTDTANVKTALNASLGGAATIGDSSDTITIPGNLTITGTKTELQITNLNVEDQFILLNSGSTSGDSGIIFGGTGNGTAQAGHSIFCDDSDGNGATFGYKSQLAHNVTTGGTPTSKLGNIESSTSAPSSAPTFQGVGTIHVKTDDNEIYIYA